VTDTAPSPGAHDLELTRSALREGLPSLGLDGGLVEVDRWVDATRSAGLPQVADTLVELQGLLTSAADAAAFRPVLERLAEQTRAAADGAADERVAGELRDLANELEQAPGSLGGVGPTGSSVLPGV